MLMLQSFEVIIVVFNYIIIFSPKNLYLAQLSFEMNNAIINCTNIIQTMHKKCHYTVIIVTERQKKAVKCIEHTLVPPDPTRGKVLKPLMKV